MDESEIISVCREIWAKDTKLRNDMDKFRKKYDTFSRALKDMDIAIRAYEQDKFKSKKFIKEFYHEALICLIEMRKIAEKSRKKDLIEYVEIQEHYLDIIRKKYL